MPTRLLSSLSLGVALAAVWPSAAQTLTASTAPAPQVQRRAAPAEATRPEPAGLSRQEPATPWAPGDFTIVVLPDTQMYTASRNGGEPAMFTTQTEWIVSNRVSRNIAYVALEGDISNDGSGVLTQWRHATNALYRLEDPARTGLPEGIPYGVAVGNHDRYHGGTAKFNQFFGIDHFAGRHYYGGHYSTNNDSHYDLFSAGGKDFIALSLTMDAGSDPDLLRWAGNVLQSHSSRQAIVVTHSLLNPAHWPSPASWTQEGPPIFQALTNQPNLFLMLCGHRHGEGRRSETVAITQHIEIMLADYQSYPHGGDGFLRLLEFSPSRSEIRVKTFSPWNGLWATDPDGCFTLACPLWKAPPLETAPRGQHP